LRAVTRFSRASPARAARRRPPPGARPPPRCSSSASSPLSASSRSRFLRRVLIGVVLFDHSVIARRRQSYYDQLLAPLREGGGAFELLTRCDLVRDGTLRPGALELYRLRGGALTPEAPLDPAFVLDAEAETLRVASGGG
jgi:hypothetical protein